MFSKCELWLREVSFLSHVISSGGIIVDPSKIDIVLQWEILKFVTEIISFLRLDGLLARVHRRFFEVGNAFGSVDSKWSSLCVVCRL